MDKRYTAVLLAVVIVLITVRAGYALTVWGDTVDPDPWKSLGDTNRYVITGHYSAGEADSLYYGAYSVGLQSLLASLTVFTGIDLTTLAQYFLQVMVPIVMVLAIYLVTSRSGTIKSWAIPVMCLFIGLYSGIIHQQSRMIEENVGFVLFCGVLFFLYLYYDARRTSRTFTFTMLSVILLLAIFTHHISFLIIALLAMPFIVSTLRLASPAYIPLIFVPWWVYYHVLNGYNGIYVGIFFYTAIGLAALYALFLLFRFFLPTSVGFQGVRHRVTHSVHHSLPTVSRINSHAGEVAIMLGIVAIVWSLLTGLQSGYLPYFLPLIPLVVYSGASSLLSSDSDKRADWLSTPFVRYLSFTVALLVVVTALGFVLQYTAGRTGALPPYLQTIKALAAVDLGNRFINWLAFLWGIMATIGLIPIFRRVHVRRRTLTASVTAVLLTLAVINTAALAADYTTSFTITAPPDRTVIAAASWAKDEDVNVVTLTDYNTAMLYWYYASEPVAYPGTNVPAAYQGSFERPNATVLDHIYPGYLTGWNNSQYVGIDYLLLTSTPAVYYSEQQVNGQWKLSDQNSTAWQTHLASINNRDGIAKIYTNNHTSYYKVIDKARA